MLRESYLERLAALLVFTEVSRGFSANRIRKYELSKESIRIKCSIQIFFLIKSISSLFILEAFKPLPFP